MINIKAELEEEERLEAEEQLRKEKEVRSAEIAKKYEMELGLKVVKSENLGKDKPVNIFEDNEFDDILNEVTNDVDKNNTEYMKETKKVVKQEAQIDFDDFKNDLNELDNGEKNEKSKEIRNIKDIKKINSQESALEVEVKTKRRLQDACCANVVSRTNLGPFEELVGSFVGTPRQCKFDFQFTIL